MKRVAIIQARMTSTRLPGKILMDLAGRPLLSQQLRRVKRAQRIDEIVVATTTNASDDPVISLAKKNDVRWFRGSEQDVLSRYALAARDVKADVVVRITSDCPLIDPVTIDAVVEKVEKGGNVDYASNILRRTYPRGLDTEAFTANVLERVNRDAKSFPAREHVTYFILQENPTMFRTQSVEDSQDNSDLRWTVDVLEDLKMVRQIYSDLNLDQTNKTYREIVAYVRANPQVSALNATVQQKKV